MPKPQDPLGRLRIATPCPTSWEGMTGDARARHCALCSLNVYNFAEMTRDEVRELLARTEGRVCARLYRRADGTVLTRDCPTGLRALRRRALRAAAALIAALFTLPVFAFGKRSCEKPRFRAYGSHAQLEIERVATPQPAVLSGVVRFVEGGSLPGVSVVVKDEASGREITAATDAKGAFTIAFLADGIYRVDMKLEGFTPATIEHLQMRAGEVTRASVALRMEAVEMGILVVTDPNPVITNNGISTMFSQDFINKMPF